MKQVLPVGWNLRKSSSTSSSPNGVVRFGAFEMNFASRELLKHGVPIRLPRQLFSILELLLEKPGEIVTREDLRLRLWGPGTFVDFEHNLNSAVKNLRKALGDIGRGKRDPLYIETIPRVGYRFVAKLQGLAKR
jgi:DNA-binding winged helix-turn-helix (wHTH) protein